MLLYLFLTVQGYCLHHGQTRSERRPYLSRRIICPANFATIHLCMSSTVYPLFRNFLYQVVRYQRRGLPNTKVHQRACEKQQQYRHTCTHHLGQMPRRLPSGFTTRTLTETPTTAPLRAATTSVSRLTVRWPGCCVAGP